MATAAELIEQARAATTVAELDVVEGQAENRTTVLDAVQERRQELAAATQPLTPPQVAQATAQAAAEAKRLKLDEAGPGHHYIVNGEKVDAEGKPVKA